MITFKTMLVLSALLLVDVVQATGTTGYHFKVIPFQSFGPIKEQALQGVSRDLSRTKIMLMPNYGVVAQATPTAEDFIGEKSMYSATPDFAREHGGPITRELLDQIPDWYYEAAKNLNMYPNIDVRVHDLNLEGIPAGHDLYPAVPGVHADGEFRETYFSQPDLSRIPVSFHIVSTVSTNREGISNTRFINTPIQMNVDEELSDSKLWAAVHRFVEGLESYEFTDMNDGGLVMFDARTLHKAMPAKKSGTRLFFRMSMWHKPNLGDGQLSKQEQLYLLPKPGFEEPSIDPTQFMRSTDQKIIGTFDGTARISELAQEQSIFGATIDEIQQNGGDTAKRLVAKIPANFAPIGHVPVVDMLIFRLYPGYRPFFPNYNGKPQAVNWHFPHLADIQDPDDLHRAAMFIMAKRNNELWMSVSSHEDGVNVTEFDTLDGGIQLQDGEILHTSAAAPRRELPAAERGWRLIMRVRHLPEGQVRPSQVITQQYVNPGSEEEGW